MRLIKLFIYLLITIFVNSVIYSQTNEINDAILDDPIPAQSGSTGGAISKIASTTQINDIIVLAVDAGASQTIPNWYNQFVSYSDDFIRTSTFDNYSMNIITLVESAGQAFRMPNPYTPPFNGACGYSWSINGHVHSNTNMIDVLTQADGQYDFDDYDYDNDGDVPVHFVSIGPSGGGVICNVWFTTSDTSSATGNPVRIVINRQSRGSNESVLKNVYTHEVGHGEFNFPDMDHSGSNYNNHYGLGGFDVMSCLGFNSNPSPYSPVLRAIRGWITPEPITINNTSFTLEEFQKDMKLYVYEPSTQPANGYGTQKFYISYHDYDPVDNPFYSSYPYAERTEGGVLLWHSNVTTLTTGSTYNFLQWNRMPIDIECAHGKTVWNETSTQVNNTGVQDPLTGRDKLEIRKVVSVGGKDTEIHGPYFGVDKGDGSVFFTPGYGQEFSLNSNPNSNFIVNNSTEGYAQAITSGFSIENIRMESSTVKANIKVNNYEIDENTTLGKGKWYINGNLTVKADVTLNIQEGTELIISNNKSLLVYGTLNVNGTASNKVIFDFATNAGSSGIKFYEGSSGTVEHAIVKDAYQGFYIYKSSPTIKNNEISNCNYGIRSFYNSPIIETNEIYDFDYYGIYAYKGSPTITDNYIYDTKFYEAEYGIVINGSVNTFIRDNTIKDCEGGLWAFGNQTIKLHSYGQNKIEGYTSDGHAVYVTGGTAHLGEYHSRGKNSFIRNSSNTVIYNSTSNEILAEKNYWGGSPQSSWFGGSGDVEWSFPYSSPPGGVGSSLGKEIAPDLTPDRRLFVEAMEQLDQNNYTEATEMFKKLINDYPDSRFAGLSVAWSMSSKKISKDLERESDYLKSLHVHKNKNVRDNSLLWLASLESELGNRNTVEEIVKSISIKEPTGVELRLNWANDLLNAYNDAQKAEEIFNELLKVGASKSTINTINAIKATSLYYKDNDVQENMGNMSSVEISNYKKLNSIYPNPFNPSTNINYHLPERAHVKLMVYNSIGEKVATLVNRQEEKGLNQTTFNASNLPSGLYIYRLQVRTFSGTGSYVDSRKMLLVK